MAGRKPKPTALKKLEGNPGKRKLNTKEPPFICYLLPGSDNFAADGKVYFKINEVRIELYMDKKDVSVEKQV